MDKQWYVFYTRSRWEKKVLALLEKKGFEVFLPMHKVMRQWSDRKKKVEVPLFNSYIFVHVTRNTIYDVLQVPGIVRNLLFDGEPAQLHDKEYKNIKYLLETGLPIDVEGIRENVSLGDHVKVIGGAFNGMEGELYRIDDSTCAIMIESLQQVLKITVHRELLSKVN